MRQITRKTLYLVLFAIISMASVTVSAVPAAFAETKIAVVDVQALLQQSDAAKSIQKQIIDQRETYQKEISAYEKDLKKMDDDFAAKKEKLSEAEIARRRSEFESKLIEARKAVQERSRLLEQAAGQATVKLRTEIVKIVAEMSEKENYTIVITKQNVILAEKELDITADIMKALNKKIKSIKLEMKP